MQKEKQPLNNLQIVENSLREALDHLSISSTLDKPLVSQNLARHLESLDKKVPFPEISVYPVEKSVSVVIQKKIPFFSFCPHHLLPVHGSVNIAYAPDSQVMSLGSLKRLISFVEQFPLLQEQATYRIADLIFEKT